jgi:sodium/pantothenate symporter
VSDVNRYLFTAVAVLTVFFLGEVQGLYARMAFPAWCWWTGAEMDKIMSAHVVREFPVYMGLLIIPV